MEKGEGYVERRKSRIGNMSLKYKISIVMIIVTLVPLLLFGTVTTYMYRNAILERSEKHIEENIRIMTDRIHTVFQTGELCTNYLTLNFNSIINDKNKREITRDNQIKSELNQSLLIFEGIDSIVFFDASGNMYSTEVTLFDRQQDIMTSNYMERLTDNNGKTILFDYGNSFMAVKEPVITMGKRVINIVSGETIGYLFVNQKISYLEESVDNEISKYLIFDSEGTYINRESNPEFSEATIAGLQENADQDTIYQNGEYYLVARMQVLEYHWTVIGITSLNEFNVSKEELMSIFLVTGLIIGALILLSISFFSTTISKPLVKLTEGAEQIAHGNMDVTFEYKTRDEIGTLAYIFNYMTRQMKELFKKIDYEARKKREYELALVQEQVKPHFLYNTLDIIIMMIEMNKGREAARVTRKLADYYKNSLSGSDEIVTIEREIQIIEDYLDLQSMRYGDKFTYEIEVEDEVLEARLPKMTLQPLVENAIYHGLKYKEEWGNIRITAVLKGSTVVLCVEDNGIGMDAEGLHRMEQLGEKAEKHFGVYSVNHRLKLYYGEEYGIQIESEYQKGTCIDIRIPFETEKESGNDDD